MNEFLEANGTFFNFMFVRHPMDRILSCYIDKILDPTQYLWLVHFRQSISKRGRQIIQKRQLGLSHNSKMNLTKKSSSTLNNLSGNLSLIDESIIATLNGSNTLNSTANVTVTFEEFLEYVLSTDLQGILSYIFF